MKRWEGNAILSSGQYLGEVSAETEEEALDALSERAGVTLCHHCSRQIGDINVEDIEVSEVDPAGEEWR